MFKDSIMKKIFYCFIFCSLSMFSQNQDLTSAIIAIDNKRDIESAKYAIDNAADKIKSGSVLKAKKMSKYYHYRGKIYLSLFEKAWFDSEIDPDFNDLNTAYNAFLEDAVLSGSHSKKSIVQLQRCASLYQDAAYREYENKNYMSSEIKFEHAITINTSPSILIVDTLNMFNACLMAFLDENYEKSIFWGSQLVNLNPSSEKYHMQLIEAYSETGVLDKQIQAIKNARLAIPHSKNIIFKEVNYYISTGDNESLLASLDDAVQKDPENPVLHFVLGSTYTSLNNTDKAINSYQQVIDLDPDYIDAYNNLAAIYLDEANIFIEKKNNLPINASQKKYNNLSVKIKDLRSQALPNLEKVFMLQPEDEIIIQTLKQIYYQLEMDKESLSMKRYLDAVQDGQSIELPSHLSKE